MKYYNSEQVRQRLRAMVRDQSITVVAKQLRISRQYLADVLEYRRDPGESILRALKLQKIVRYAEK